MNTVILYMKDPISGMDVRIFEVEKWRMEFAHIHESGMELILTLVRKSSIFHSKL